MRKENHGHAPKVALILFVFVAFQPLVATAELLPIDTVQEEGWRSAVRCGPNALYMLLVASGIDVDLDELHTKIPVDFRGSNLKQLLSIGREYDSSLAARKLSREELSALSPPFIVHFESVIGQESGHYQLVVSLDRADASGNSVITVVDPITFVETSYPPSDFYRSWSGYSLFREETPLLRAIIREFLFLSIGPLFCVLVYFALFSRNRKREG